MAKQKSTSRSRKMLKSRRERDKKKAAETKAKASEETKESKESKATEPKELKESKATEPKEPKAPTAEDSGFKAPAEIPVTPTTAARKAIRQEQFDFNAPSSWTGGGGYKYEYTPGEGGGSITISGGPSNMKGTTINRSSKFFEPIMEEYYRGDVDMAAPAPEPMAKEDLIEFQDPTPEERSRMVAPVPSQKPVGRPLSEEEWNRALTLRGPEAPMDEVSWLHSKDSYTFPREDLIEFQDPTPEERSRMVAPIPSQDSFTPGPYPKEDLIEFQEPTLDSKIKLAAENPEMYRRLLEDPRLSPKERINLIAGVKSLVAQRG